jgi:virginiamycin B lyase
MLRPTVFALVLTLAPAVNHAQVSPAKAPRPPVEIPLARLKADATVAVAFAPGAVESTDAVWVLDRTAGTIVRLDAKDNSAGKPIAVGAQPCASLLVAFESVWVPLCGGAAIARADVKTGKVTTPLKMAVADPEGRVASGVGSIWAISDRKGVLSRIDPDTNMPVAEIYVAGGAASVVSSGDALWVTSDDVPSTSLRAGSSSPQQKGLLTRINPHNNEVVEVVAVGPKPGRLAVGEGGVWTLNRGNGTVSRVDPASNKVVATIAVGEDAATGEIAAAFGSVWISAPGVPIVRIDPRTNRAVQRFTGDGGGAILAAHGSLWLAAGPGVTWRLDPALVAAMRP